MPGTAKVFIAVMAMAMMTLIGAVVLHVVVGVAIAGDSGYALSRSTQWSFWLEGARRTGIALYLLASPSAWPRSSPCRGSRAVRVRELPDEVPTTPPDGLTA